MDETKHMQPRIAKRKKLGLFLLPVAIFAAAGACTLAQILDPTSTVPPDPSVVEPVSDLYKDPQPVQINGYREDMMEPFITGDGKYLLFNNSNASHADTHIHLCKRVGAFEFNHLGLLPGSVSKSKDMAPSVDANGNMYYTCLKSFEKDGHSIYTGRFFDGKLTDVGLPKGDISPHKPAEINMDCDASKDGNMLILSRAHFANALLPPDRSDLVLATKSGGMFRVESGQAGLLSNQNTTALEYAPCLSADGLELFFTRAGKLSKADARRKFDDPHDKSNDREVYFRIMVARRKSTADPFGKPSALGALAGFVEAPTITDDKKEMFYHKKMGDQFRIFRAVRNSAATEKF